MIEVNRAIVPPEAYCTVITKGDERYVIKFTSRTRNMAIGQVACWARDKSLSLTYADANTIRDEILRKCPA